MKRKMFMILLVLVLIAGLLLGACAKEAPAPAPAPAPKPAPAPAPTPAPTPAPAPKPAPTPAPTPAPAPKPAPATINLKYHDNFAATKLAGTRPCQFWMREVEKRSGGRVKFEEIHGGALGKIEEQMDQIKVGLFDVGMPSPIYHEAKTPTAAIGSAPFVTNNMAAYSRALSELEAHPANEAMWFRYNQRALFWSASDPFEIESHVPIRTLADLKGVTMRAHGIAATAMEKLGATPVFIPSPELFSALERKVVQSAIFALTIARDYGHLDVVKYITYTGGVQLFPYITTINNDTWNKLPTDIQKIMMDVAKEVPVACAEMFIPELVDSVAKAKAKGIQFFEWSAEDRAKAKEIGGKPVRDQWAKEIDAKGLPGTELMNSFLEKIKQYEKEYPKYG